MNKVARVLILAMTLTFAAAGVAMATPSTQIWIPSTDVLDYKTFHLGIDNYFRASGVGKVADANGVVHPGTRDPNVMDIGPLMGISPFEKVKVEAGFDYLVNASEPNDNHPWSGHFKIGTPEDSICKFSPALAVGMYNVGPSQSKTNAPGVTSGQNIAYVLVARTLPDVGRLSAGYYRGSERALVNTSGNAANDGALLSWDRTMAEISDKLWMAVDYQSGNNVDGAVNFGASWKFAKNVSLIFAYDVYTKKSLSGNNTFTTQLDIDFP